LFGLGVVHQQADLSLAEHPGQIGRSHLGTYIGHPALRCAGQRRCVANEKNDNCHGSSSFESLTR
jgi:hypothetical protein